MPHFIATCATGLEYLLVDELTALGAESAKEGLSQVAFDCDWPGIYRILMWTRLASRIHYPIAQFSAIDDDQLYNQASIIDWTQHIRAGGSFLINSQSFRSKLNHTQFISQRIKDAIVDYFAENDETRPNVDFDEPQVVIHCRVRHDKVTLSIDLSGFGLHKRSYRMSGGDAPIKENLAAALLTRAGWNKKIAEGEPVLLDPMCGSGTFLIEGAMMALDIAPGLQRDYLGIWGWRQFDAALWDTIKLEAEQRKQQGSLSPCIIMGSDINPRAVRAAQSNVAQAGLESVIKIRIASIEQLEEFELPDSGLLIVNPPYSERLGEVEQVKKLYRELGSLLKNKFQGWQASVLSPNKEFGHELGIRAKKIYKFNNGSIPCELLNLELLASSFLEIKNKDQVDLDFRAKLSPQAMQLCNRLEKNLARLKKYLGNNQISCYRLYDSDLPDFNAAIDVYDGRVHIQEYKAPKSVDEKLAARRLKDIESVTAGVLGLPLSQVFLKQRRRQKGDWQYQQNKSEDFYQNFFQVEEAGRKFWVNLVDYLDTGLFLDHRETRKLIAEKAKNKDFLNLFCYTASVSVYAATGGAQSTTSIDMSNTYLDWARRNFSLNKINLAYANHQFLREDCVHWLETESEKLNAGQSVKKYDLIFLDPPTFSNSKKMEQDFDVQTQHPRLIEKCCELLKAGGELIFSNNFQKFEMLVESDERYLVKEITRLTRALDFERNNLHRCWSVKLKD